MPKPFQMSREIRAHARQELGSDTDPISLEIVQPIGPIHDVLQHDHMRYHIPLFAPLCLLDRVRTPQHRATTGQPIRARVRGFDLRRFSADVLAHGGIGHILQQKNGALDATSLAQSFVQRVLATLHAEPLQEHGGQDLPRLDR